MKKRYILSAVGTAGAISATASYFLKNKTNRDKLKQKVNRVTTKFKMNADKPNASTFDSAGAPDQTETMDEAQLENAKMVSEGSQFGVHYYNNVKEKENNY
ncbi:hypothetical protein QGM71_04845 [Virgibacillus sp. C22-A2]|uniref:YtxH domain-containing protein n=1 Tax=Virgibacillus tibetensis TaxID=3042313 RepID=A0ABU6KCD5_9BACI|nr:hypothetical protein [Virgibacillus sp. C22-A2]